VEKVFGLWLGGARPEAAAALRQWAVELAPQLRVLPAPEHPDEEPQEDGVHLQAGAIWQVPEVPRNSATEGALLADFRLVIERATAFSVEHPCEVAVLYGCCEVGYIEDGVAEPGLAAFFAEADTVPVHEHG
jgi:hypothetical protein